MDKLEIQKIRELECFIRKAINVKARKPTKIRNLTQMQIMLYLINSGDKTIYQKELGEALKLKKSSITEHLDYLESIECIERVQDKNDKRKNSVQLSKMAIEYKNELDNSIKDLNSQIIKGITEEELECFSRVIKKMEDNIKD